jgi:hypothetical protein
MVSWTGCLRTEWYGVRPEIFCHNLPPGLLAPGRMLGYRSTTGFVQAVRSLGSDCSSHRCLRTVMSHYRTAGGTPSYRAPWPMLLRLTMIPAAGRSGNGDISTGIAVSAGFARLTVSVEMAYRRAGQRGILHPAPSATVA